MYLINFILNVAGLLIWLSWRASRFDPVATARPSTLAGTLRRAESRPVKRWHMPVALACLLVLRSHFYWQMGSSMNWSASLNVAAISVSFASFGPGAFLRMLLFSILSFAATLGVFLLWMLFLSLLCRPSAELNLVRRFVRLHIGRVDDWPGPLKALLPLLSVGILWWLLTWPLVHWDLLPQPTSIAHRTEQSLIIGLASYLAWKHIIVGVLALHLLNSYVYLGSHPFWKNISLVARRLLWPLHRLPMSIGKLDLSPALVIVLVLAVTQCVENGVNLPPWSNSPSFKLPGLVDLYRYVAT